MPQETALTFIVTELIISTIIFLIAYQKSPRMGMAVTGLLQGMLSVSTILSGLGLKNWWEFALGSTLIFIGGIVGVLLALLIYVSVQKSKNPLVVDAKAL